LSALLTEPQSLQAISLTATLNDQLENYYLKNVAKIEVVRIPFLQTTIKKDKLEKFILDDLQRRLSAYS